MRKTFQKLLSKTLLAAFIFLFAASPVFAQTDWTPPTGPATGNNVEPPINTSVFEQTKRGNLNLEGDLILDGSKTPTALDPGPWVFSNWLTSFFGDDVIIGSPLAGGGNQGPFPILFLNGTFRYSPKAIGTGAIAPLSAEELADGGYNNVLIGDAQGNVRWTDSANVGGSGTGPEVDPRLPFGTAANQVLTWNGTAWVPGTGGGGGGTILPDGTNQNDILVWDVDSQTWIVAAYPTGGGTLPPGTQGQTMWYNGTGWQATNRISYTQDIFPPNSHTLHVGDLNTAGTVVVEDSSVAIKGPSIEIGYANDTGTTNIKGNSLFLESTNVAINNVSSNPLAGRFLFSKDDNGKVEWNKNLVYARETFFGDSFYDVVSVLNEPGLTPGQNGYLGTYFVNEGATYLKGNTAIDGETVANEKVTIKDPGDLYLEGVDYPPAIYWENATDSHGNPISPTEANSNKLKQLCIDTETSKVVFCSSPDPKPAATHEYVTVTCTPTGCDHGVTLPYEFTEDATVDIEYCAGGGGGGGGGKGFDLPAFVPLLGDEYPADGGGGTGGGGGGGGVAGECNNYDTVDVAAGDVIDATIGTGGNGGGGAYKSEIYSATPSLAGFNPVLTVLYTQFGALPASEEIVFQSFETQPYNNPPYGGNEGSPTNVSLTGFTFDQASGGLGGYPGGDGTGGGNGGAGQGGNSLISSAWHDGVGGAGPLPPYGGQGGDGESPDVIANNGATVITGGGGGGGGVGDSLNDISHGGSQGKLSFGGGGGSGGFGDYYEEFGCGQGAAFNTGDFNLFYPGTEIPAPGAIPAPATLYHNVCRILKGGNGGDGGDGYLKIHNFPIQIAPPPTQFVYESPSANPYVLDWSSIPSFVDDITVKVWGAGGGGGRAKENTLTATEDILAGGGGAGGYTEAIIPRQNSGSMEITIGAGGLVGAAGAANPGGAGGQSKFDITIAGVNDLIANGGLGGGGDSENSPGGAGGAGGTASGGTNDTGPNGESGASGGLGGDQSGATGFADGGIGGIVNNISGNALVDRNPTAGKPGRVEITW